MNWTIAFGGTEKLVADWGFGQLQRKLVSQGQDELTFAAEGAAADGVSPFTPFESVITLWRDRELDDSGNWTGGTVWFTGIIIQIPRRGAPDAESNGYKAAGPWWYLDTRVFEKTFNIFDHLAIPGDLSSAVYVQKTFSHCFLNIGPTPAFSQFNMITTGQQIIEALNWALKPFTDAGAPAPFQVGTVSPALLPPFTEVRDITCAEVLHKMLRWSPDAVTWFDYTTSPPTFHCDARANLETQPLALNGGDLIRDLRVNPRYDLLTPYVLINYEQTTTVNGQSWVQPFQDFYPNPLPTAPLAQFNAVRATIDLQGLHANSTTANLVCDAITADPVAAGAQAWWLARHPQYTPFDPTVPPDAGGPTNAADPNNPITNFQLIPGSLTVKPTNPNEALLNLPNELRTGQIAPWMGFQTQRITLTVKANITHRNGNVVREHPLTYQCMSTNASSGPYSNTTVTQIAEPVPSGLAEALYNAASVLQYDGELTLQEAEVSGSAGVGTLLNLTGGNLAEWATMNAMVQSVTENLDTGQTKVEFGPPKHLGAGELVDLLRVNRSRTIFYWPTLQTSGVGAGAESVALGDNTPEKNSASTPGFTQSHVVSGTVDGSEQPNVVSQVAQNGLAGGFAAFTHWTPTGPYAPGSSGTPPATPGSITICTTDIDAADVSSGVVIKLQKLAICLNGQSGGIYFLCSQFIPDN